MKKIALGVLAALVLVVLLAVGGLFFAKSKAKARLAEKRELAVEAIPIPFPLSEAELRELPEGADPAAVAHERAVKRGKRYIESRAACTECHGEDLGGKVIVDDPAMGKWVAPNITRGGLVAEYTSEDWVRTIRHGIGRDGTPLTMPSDDFSWFSDQEVSDLAAYILSVPPVKREMGPSEFGPIFSILIATGEMPLSANTVDHKGKRRRLPPEVKANVELGAHLGATCRGCHGQEFAGGPVVGGDPSWPPAANLTSHEQGLAGWSLGDFKKALREGLRPDGRKLDASMPVPYTARLQDEEIEALYLYLRSVKQVPRPDL